MSDSISTLGEHLRQKAINDINKDRSPFAALLYAKNMLEANKAVHEQASNIFSITGGDDNKRQDEAFLDAKKQYNEAKALNFEAPYSVQRMEKSGNYPKYLLSNLQEIPEISLHYTASSIPFLYNWAISVGGNTRAASTAEKYKENNNIEDEKFYNDDWREYKNKAKSTQLLTKYREAAGAENLVAGIGFIPTGGLAVQALKGGVKQGFKKTVANSLKKQGEGFLSEAIGEGAEAATGTILENIANNKKWNEDLGKEVLNSATIGGVVGANIVGVSSTPSIVNSVFNSGIKQNNAQQQTKSSISQAWGTASKINSRKTKQTSSTTTNTQNTNQQANTQSQQTNIQTNQNTNTQTNQQTNTQANTQTSTPTNETILEKIARLREEYEAKKKNRQNNTQTNQQTNNQQNQQTGTQTTQQQTTAQSQTANTQNTNQQNNQQASNQQTDTQFEVPTDDGEDIYQPNTQTKPSGSTQNEQTTSGNTNTLPEQESSIQKRM